VTKTSIADKLYSVSLHVLGLLPSYLLLPTREMKWWYTLCPEKS